MRCERAERWISDDLDGMLNVGRRKKLAAHLASCPDCRAYRRRLGILQDAARTASRADVPPEYWPEALRRLEARILAKPRPSRPFPVRIPAGRWAWAGAASLLAAAAAFFLLLAPARVPEEVLPLAFEDQWGALGRQLGDDSELTRTLSASIQSALDESLREVHGDVVPFLDGNAWFLEALSDEEVRLVNVELAKEIPN